MFKFSQDVDSRIIVRLVNSTYNGDEVALRAESVKLGKDKSLVLQGCERVVIKKKAWWSRTRIVTEVGARNQEYRLPLENIFLPSWRWLAPKWYREISAAA